MYRIAIEFVLSIFYFDFDSLFYLFFFLNFDSFGWKSQLRRIENGRAVIGEAFGNLVGLTRRRTNENEKERRRNKEIIAISPIFFRCLLRPFLQYVHRGSLTEIKV